MVSSKRILPSNPEMIDFRLHKFEQLRFTNYKGRSTNLAAASPGIETFQPSTPRWLRRLKPSMLSQVGSQQQIAAILGPPMSGVSNELCWMRAKQRLMGHAQIITICWDTLIHIDTFQSIIK